LTSQFKRHSIRATLLRAGRARSHGLLPIRGTRTRQCDRRGRSRLFPEDSEVRRYL